MRRGSVAEDRFRGVQRRVHRLHLAPSFYTDDDNGTRFKERVWQPRTGLMRASTFPKNPARIDALFEFQGADGSLSVVKVEGNGQVSAYTAPAPNYEGVSSSQIDAFDQNSCATWNEESVPAVNLMSCAQDNVTFTEGTGSMRLTNVYPAPFGNRSLEHMKGRDLSATPINALGFTNIVVSVASDANPATAQFRMELVDNVGSSFTVLSTTAVSVAFASHAFPLASFLGLNMGALFNARFRMISDPAGGNGVTEEWRFDNLRLE